jgi:Fibronectin type III domain
MRPILPVLLTLSSMISIGHAAPLGGPSFLEDGARLQALEDDEAVEGGEAVVADDRRSPPPAPENLRFLVHFPFAAESLIGLDWDRSRGADGYRIYRRVQQIATNEALFGPIDPDEGVSPFDWRELGDTESTLWDDKITPPDPEGPPYQKLHVGPYCYMVEAFNEAGSTESEAICRRIRDVNEPSDPKLVDATPTSLTLTWIDTSQIEMGFRVGYYAVDEGRDDRKFVILPTANTEQYVLSGLQPDTEYCVTVQAVSWYESSTWGAVVGDDGFCNVRTLPEPEAEPEEQTVKVDLIRQIILEGPIPYTAVYPAFGNPFNAVVTKISSNPGAGSLLQFVKPNFTTADCGNQDAVVILEQQGGTLDPDEIEEIYGTPTPSLPIYFVACGGPSPVLLNSIPINLTYRVEE